MPTLRWSRNPRESLIVYGLNQAPNVFSWFFCRIITWMNMRKNMKVARNLLSQRISLEKSPFILANFAADVIITTH